MKRLLTILVLALLLCGCRADEGRYLEYAAGAFEATVEGSVGELNFTAEIKAGAPVHTKAEPPPPRDIEMIFLGPETLAGIRIVRKDGRVSVFLGELSADGRHADGWLATAALLIPEGRITGAERVTEDGVKMTKVEMRTGDSGLLTLWIDRSGYPLRMMSSPGGIDTDIRVRAFVPKQ